MGIICNARIVTARGITGSLPAPHNRGNGNAVIVGDVGGEEVAVFYFYSDELAFSASDVEGLTLDQARTLKSRRDMAYIQAG